jgi:hypothetical protein
MGWLYLDCDPHGVHEGYIVGLKGSKNHFWKEMYFNDGHEEQLLDAVQAGCDCGWRSRRLMAPHGARWVPNSVMAPEQFEDEVRKLWAAHVEEEARQGAKVYG